MARVIDWLKKLVPRVGPKVVSPKEMEESIDEFQEKYGAKEKDIPEAFRNKDKSKWKIK